MSSAKRDALRSHLEKIVSLDGINFDPIASGFTSRLVKKGDILVNPSERVQHTFWVEKGLLYSIYIDTEGHEHVIQFAIENCWITDQDAFYNQAPSTFTIRALEDSTVLALSFRDREKLCSEFPPLNHFFRKKANDSFVKQQKRLLTYLTSDAQERFDQLLLEYPGLYQRVPKKILAAYLGVSRETLSRMNSRP